MTIYIDSLQEEGVENRGGSREKRGRRTEEALRKVGKLKL